MAIGHEFQPTAKAMAKIIISNLRLLEREPPPLTLLYTPRMPARAGGPTLARTDG